MDTYLNDHDYEKAISTFKTFGKSKMPLAKTMEAIVMADKENPKANPKKAIKLLRTQPRPMHWPNSPLARCLNQVKAQKRT